MNNEYTRLLPHATPAQARLLRAIVEHGTRAAAIKALGIDERSARRLLVRAREQAARANPAEHVEQAPTGYHLKGVSTLVNGAGEPVMQWRKTVADLPAPADYAQAVEDALATLKGVKPRRAPQHKGAAKDRLTVIPVGDPHFGMLAWPAETGEVWDLRVAGQVHRDAIARLLDKVPDAAEALIVWMGDNAHADDTKAATPASGHHLDVDSRWHKMLDKLIAAMVNSAEQALERHARVRMRIVLGNHDPHVSAALALALACYYRDEPRVTVERQPTPLFVTTWGRVLLAFAHGHAPAPERVPDILAADYRKEIGSTEQGYLYTGHKHNKELRERGGLVMEAVQTLAAKDAYATHAGYRSARGIFADTYDRRFLCATDRAMVAAQDVQDTNERD